jgi:hypothetical protein
MSLLSLAYSDLCLWLYFLGHYHRAQRLKLLISRPNKID